MSLFLPRALYKGPKRSLVVVVVVGVETWAKNVHNVTKNVREQNLLQIEQKNVTKGTKNFGNENGVWIDMIIAKCLCCRILHSCLVFCGF